VPSARHAIATRRRIGERGLNIAPALPQDNNQSIMQLPDTIHPAFARTSFAPALERLHGIYARIERGQAESLAAIAARGPALACPEGCGSCCEPFIPDVLPVEARYLAAWLLRERPLLAERIARWPEGLGAVPPCPFYDAVRPGGHCTVYPARPLICRLFGFSALRDREGRESFALCKRMPSRPGGRSWSGSRLEEELGASLPDMADFSASVVTLVPDEAGERALLTEALPQAVRRLALAMRLALASSAASAPDGDEPEPSTPAPAPAAA